MSGPWEKYAAPQPAPETAPAAATDGPWSKYGQPGSSSAGTSPATSAPAETKQKAEAKPSAVAGIVSAPCRGRQWGSQPMKWSAPPVLQWRPSAISRPGVRAQCRRGLPASSGRRARIFRCLRQGKPGHWSYRTGRGIAAGCLGRTGGTSRKGRGLSDWLGGQGRRRVRRNVRCRRINCHRCTGRPP